MEMIVGIVVDAMSTSKSEQKQGKPAPKKPQKTPNVPQTANQLGVVWWRWFGGSSWVVWSWFVSLVGGSWARKCILGVFVGVSLNLLAPTSFPRTTSKLCLM